LRTGNHRRSLSGLSFRHGQMAHVAHTCWRRTLAIPYLHCLQIHLSLNWPCLWITTGLSRLDQGPSSQCGKHSVTSSPRPSGPLPGVYQRVLMNRSGMEMSVPKRKGESCKNQMRQCFLFGICPLARRASINCVLCITVVTSAQTQYLDSAALCGVGASTSETAVHGFMGRPRTRQ
jgi:hypothetical protein